MTVKEMIKILRRLPVDADLFFVTSISENESIVSEISNIVAPANHLNNMFYLYSEDFAEEYFKNIKE